MMKRLLLMGTALLSIAPYAGAMNSDQKDSKTESLSEKKAPELSNSIIPPLLPINNNNAPLPPIDEDESDAFTTSELTSSSNTINPIYKNLIKALFDHNVSKEDFFNQLETFKQEYNNQNLDFEILKNEMIIAFFNNPKEGISILIKALDRINLKDLEAQKSQPNSFDENELPPPPSINIPPINESNSSTVTDETKSKIWNNYFDNFLSNPDITDSENERELNRCFDATAVDGKVIISPSDWKDGGKKILDILENFKDIPNNQRRLSELASKVRSLDYKFDIRYQGFELKAPEQVKRLYNIFHSKEFISSYSNHETIQHLFHIFIEKQNAQISEELVSDLLKDQDIIDSGNSNYLYSSVITRLIASGEGSLKDMNLPENILTRDPDILTRDLILLKSIVRKVILQHQKELHCKITSEENKKLVDKKISIIQTNIVEPLKNIEGLFEKLISLHTKLAPDSLTNQILCAEKRYYPKSQESTMYSYLYSYFQKLHHLFISD